MLNLRATNLRWVSVLLGVLVAAASGSAQERRRERAEHPAPPTAEDLLAGFRSMPGLTARFVEEKRLALLTRPVRTEGTVAFAPPGVLVRRVTSPTESVALIRDGQLTLASGERQETIPLGNNDIVSAFVDTFRHVLAGETDALGELYRFRYETEGSTWRLRLTPRSDTLLRFLAHLDLEGVGRGLTRMTMVEQSGDTTTTTFTEVDPRHRFSDRERATVFAIP